MVLINQQSLQTKFAVGGVEFLPKVEKGLVFSLLIEALERRMEKIERETRIMKRS